MSRVVAEEGEMADQVFGGLAAKMGLDIRFEDGEGEGLVLGRFGSPEDKAGPVALVVIAATMAISGCRVAVSLLDDGSIAFLGSRRQIEYAREICESATFAKRLEAVQSALQGDGKALRRERRRRAREARESR